MALKHWEGVPKQDGGGQINILKSEFNRKVRHMPIRKLIQEAGTAIQAIKPVIMMSPMSIANFLSPESIDFDLVIFDEASQVRPVDALGAILRGKQIVVVGDTKQMPPTSFFDKLNTETEDEENVTADMQSILGMCDAQGAPQRMLRWHYRSRHESLISLSNQEFYENKLVIFPSPSSKNRMGLSFNHLTDAFYDKGKTRTNPKEAEKVADAVIEHALRTPKLSLGVVAFSTAQMQAIQNAIELRRRKNPEVESYFRAHADEPFFVKNLENVQGDERDVIFISIGYGRTEDGKVPMSFGPLNNEGGERRLNVLITRAKNRCEVFTNITSSDMTIGPNAKFGIRALKSFLYFAQHGKFESDSEEAPYKPQPFEKIVAETLRNAGYIVREKVGSAGFYIDMAIVDAANPGRYLLGINCDGKSYQAAKSTRDRDRLRNTVLEGMGWNLLNVWSLDWFRNPPGELNLLIDTIEKAKTHAEHNDTIEEELMEELKNLIREERVEEENLIYPAYELAILPSEIAGQELHMHPLGKLSNWIHDVVMTESPVHFEEMARRISSIPYCFLMKATSRSLARPYFCKEAGARSPAVTFLSKKTACLCITSVILIPFGLVEVVPLIASLRMNRDISSPILKSSLYFFSMFIWKTSNACLTTFSFSILSTLRRFLVNSHRSLLINLPVLIVIDFCLKEIFAKIGDRPFALAFSVLM